MKKLPDLEAWAIFAKVAETGSFAATATEFGLSQATISKAITRLEGRLKVSLFHRTSRRMSLTESGRSSLERAARILAEGEAVESDVTLQAASPRGLVRLAAPMSFGLGHLAPLLPDFMATYPEVSLEIEFSDELTDLVAHGFDLALRISTLSDSSLLAQRMCTVRILLVGAPSYFAEHGQPTHPAELSAHRTLFYTQSRLGDAWRFEHAKQGSYSVAVVSPLRVNNAEALGPALNAGLGLALQPEFMVWDDLEAGRLQIAMPAWTAPSIALHLVTPPSRARPARVQVLIDYLSQRLRNAPWALSH
ncbi:MAG: bacterial regulatory helix-turn-helix, lysR family protein [Rhizobacter sp.]|nr:bacterial regulatory helix-turn-helix, lysR family protein [Rhizobacter sp.]